MKIVATCLNIIEVEAQPWDSYDRRYRGFVNTYGIARVGNRIAINERGSMTDGAPYFTLGLKATQRALTEALNLKIGEVIYKAYGDDKTIVFLRVSGGIDFQAPCGDRSLIKLRDVRQLVKLLGVLATSTAPGILKDGA